MCVCVEITCNFKSNILFLCLNLENRFMIENYANNNGLVNQEQINHSIINQGFSESTIILINNFTSDILNGKSNLTKFNQKEHAGLCCAGEVLIGAYVVCNYARTSFTTSGDAFESKRNVPNWEIDELQEKLVQEWAESKQMYLLILYL